MFTDREPTEYIVYSVVHVGGYRCSVGISLTLSPLYPRASPALNASAAVPHICSPRYRPAPLSVVGAAPLLAVLMNGHARGPY